MKDIDSILLFIKKVEADLKIESVIIDSDWGNASRLVYGLNNSDEVAESILKVDFLNFQIVEKPLPFVTTLCHTTYKQALTFNSKSRFLNIKSVDEYRECFVRWINTWCYTKKDFEDELKLIEGFKLVYYKGWPASELVIKENDLKKAIKKECKKRMKERIGILESILPEDNNENNN